MAGSTSRARLSELAKDSGERPFDEVYPNITAWVNGHGWIEIGCDDCRTSFIRILDLGGMVWESGAKGHKTMTQALAEAEAVIARWRVENERQERGTPR